MATEEEVEETLRHLMSRLSDIDPAYRSMMPSRRTIQAECTDLGVTYHATWRAGELGELQPGTAPRPDIRLRCASDDLLAMARGELDPARAYATDRLGIQASMTDLLRLRAVL